MNVSVPDAMTISIQPWMNQRLTPLKKRLSILTLVLHLQIMEIQLFLNVPPLTEEKKI